MTGERKEPLRWVSGSQHLGSGAPFAPTAKDATVRLGTKPEASGHLLSFRTLIITVIGVALVWAIATRTLVAALADSNPKAALSLRPTDAQALLNLADNRLEVDPKMEPAEQGSMSEHRKEAKPSSGTQATRVDPNDRLPALAPAEFEQVRAWAEGALANDPLNARAFRILGQISLRDADEKRTATLMRAAARRSLFESRAVYWMMRQSYQDRNYSAAIGYADVLLRTRPSIPQLGVVLLATLAETPEAVRDVEQLLAQNPPWRPKFFEFVSQYVSDPRSPLKVLLKLKDAGTTPSAEDLSYYLNFLLKKGNYDLAYYTWLQFLPAEELRRAGYLFNGSFESPPTDLPFDWVLTAGTGANIEIAPRPEANGERALFTAFGPGRVEDFSVTQITMLGPGSYLFKGELKSGIAGARGPEWRISCARGSKTLIGESPAAPQSGSGWENFEFSFTVPNEDCSEQRVELMIDSRSTADRFVSGSVWYDNLQIRHEETTSVP